MKISFMITHVPTIGQPIMDGLDSTAIGVVLDFEQLGTNVFKVKAELSRKAISPYMGQYPIHSYQVLDEASEERIDHPSHYGGKDNPYEAIKVIESWGLGFNLGNAVKYISRAGKKDAAKLVEDLKKALWYVQREVWRLDGRPEPPKADPAKEAAAHPEAVAAMDDAISIAQDMCRTLERDKESGAAVPTIEYLDGICAKLIRRRDEINRGIPRRG